MMSCGLYNRFGGLERSELRTSLIELIDPRTQCYRARGLWAVVCGLWAVGCSLWAVDCALWAVGCGLWAVGCELWAVGCGLRALGCEV